MRIIKHLASNRLYQGTIFIFLGYSCLLYFQHSAETVAIHILEFLQELLALALLVIFFEKHSEAKVEIEKSAEIRSAIAWLVNPNTIQISAKNWATAARGTEGVANQPMPFHEINKFYYDLVLLAVKAPDFTEFSRELLSLKNALAVSESWERFRSIRAGSVIKYNQQLDPILKEVDSVAKNIEEVWLPYEIETIGGKKI